MTAVVRARRVDVLQVPRNSASIAGRAHFACVLEASAPKPGNVSPGQPFADVRYEDFLASAEAIARPFEGAGRRPLGETILLAVEATAARTRANTNLGIVLLTLVGAVALCGLERHRRHPLTVTAYGSGIALIVDELALLIDLQDVYWAKDGRWSVDAAVGTVAVGGLYLAAVPFWHRAVRQVVTTCAEAASGQLPTPAL